MSFRSDLGALLREPHFGRLYATRLISQAADGAFQASLASAVLFSPERTTTAADAAAGFAVLLLPYSLVGPFAGVFLDRWSRARVLVVANVVRATLVVLVAALLVTTGAAGLPFYVAALSVISVNRFFLATLSASLPHVVRRPLLIMGNSVTTTSGIGAALVGGVCALGVRALAGADDAGSAAIAVCAAGTYLCAAAVAARMRRDLLGPDHRTARVPTREALGDVLAGLVAGARHVASHRPAAHALAAMGAHRFFYGVSTLATLLLYRNYFTGDGVLRAGIVGLGQIFTASAVGVFAAAVVTPGVTARIGKPAWIATLFAGASVVEVVFGLPYTKASFLVAACCLGFAAQGSKICVDTIVQESVEDDFRGRVFSFYDTLFNLTFVSAAVVAALTLPTTGKSYAVLGAIAVGYALTALLYALVSARAARPQPSAPVPANPRPRATAS